MENTQTSTSLDIQVRIDRLLLSDSTTKAFASVTLCGAFAVHDIRISEKDGNIMVNMPFRSFKTNGETKYVDTFHPITSEARAALHNAIKDAYEKALKEHQAAD